MFDLGLIRLRREQDWLGDGAIQPVTRHQSEILVLRMWRWLAAVTLDSWEAAGVLTVNILALQWMLRDGCADSPRTQGLRRRMNSQCGLCCCRFTHKHLNFYVRPRSFMNYLKEPVVCRLLYMHCHRALNTKCSVVIVVYREGRLPSVLWYCSEWSVVSDIWWL